MRGVKVAVLGTRGFPGVQGGVETHCENLYPLLVKEGCRVTVFTRKPYVDIRQKAYKGLDLVPLPCSRNKFLEAPLHTLAGVFAARKMYVDILHIHAIGPCLFVPLARLLGLKVVMTHHGPDYLRKKWGMFARAVLRLGEALGARWANAVICVSQSTAERIRRQYKRKVAFIPNGVQLKTHLSGQGEDEGDILKRYALTKNRYILAVGRFVPEKGFHDLISAYSLFKIPTSKLVIVGAADHPDSYTQDLKNKAAKNSNIVLTGILDKETLNKLYAQAGLFVLPSYYEEMPLVLLEAVSLGLPCIASDIAAHREVGVLSADRFFPAGDVRALAERIERFMFRPLSGEERKAQQEVIVNNYDWKVIAKRTLSLYSAL